MTPDEMRQLAADAAARAEAATPGPWEIALRRSNAVYFRLYHDGPGTTGFVRTFFERDAAFIAAARADVPALSAALVEAADHIDDLTGYYTNIMATSGHQDEKHCTCVPALRKEVERLTAHRDALRAELDATNDLFDNAVRELTQYSPDWQWIFNDRRATLKAAGGE